MFEFISKLLKRKPSPMKRSAHRGDELTEDELKFVEEKRRCPDCQVGGLLEGPSGALCTNYLCDICGSKFNLAGVWFGERLNEPSPELKKN